MAVTAINPALANLTAAARTQANQQPAAGQALGTDTFLKLLTTQLRYQNPLDPEKGTEFLSQLATFSQLQGINQLNSSLSSLVLLNQVSQAAGLIGKQVTYQSPDSNQQFKGVVQSVTMQGGQLKLQVGSATVGLDQVRGIAAA